MRDRVADRRRVQAFLRWAHGAVHQAAPVSRDPHAEHAARVARQAHRLLHRPARRSGPAGPEARLGGGQRLDARRRRRGRGLRRPRPLDARLPAVRRTRRARERLRRARRRADAARHEAAAEEIRHARVIAAFGHDQHAAQRRHVRLDELTREAQRRGQLLVAQRRRSGEHVFHALLDHAHRVSQAPARVGHRALGEPLHQDGKAAREVAHEVGDRARPAREIMQRAGQGGLRLLIGRLAAEHRDVAVIAADRLVGVFGQDVVGRRQPRVGSADRPAGPVHAALRRGGMDGELPFVHLAGDAAHARRGRGLELGPRVAGRAGHLDLERAATPVERGHVTRVVVGGLHREGVRPGRRLIRLDAAISRLAHGRADLIVTREAALERGLRVLLRGGDAPAGAQQGLLRGLALRRARGPLQGSLRRDDGVGRGLAFRLHRGHACSGGRRLRIGRGDVCGRAAAQGPHPDSRRAAHSGQGEVRRHAAHGHDDQGRLAGHQGCARALLAGQFSITRVAGALRQRFLDVRRVQLALITVRVVLRVAGDGRSDRGHGLHRAAGRVAHLRERGHPQGRHAEVADGAFKLDQRRRAALAHEGAPLPGALVALHPRRVHGTFADRAEGRRHQPKEGGGLIPPVGAARRRAAIGLRDGRGYLRLGRR